jgi:LysM repeat protein
MSKPVTFVLIFAFFFSCSFMIFERLSEDTYTATVVVRANDTLWGIAEELDYNPDVGYVVEKIKELNGLNDCTIYPGQELIIPNTGEQLLGLELDTNDGELEN